MEIFMPKQLLEASTISVDSLTGAVWKIKVIEGDRKGSSAFYPKAAVEAGAPLFAKGTRVYANHPSVEEKWNLPERKIEDLVGVFETDAVFDGSDLYANVRFFSEYQQDIKEKALAGVIGMSIRASGDVEETADGPVLKAFTSVTSVDVVTTAGAGGGFVKLLESGPEISASESGAESLEEKESAMDPKLEAALDALVETAKQNADAVAKLVERADKEDQDKADALVEAARVAAEAEKPAAVDPLAIVAKLAESKLAPAAQARVLDVVKAGKDLAEAITAEQEYQKTILAEAGATFRGNGSEESLEESKAKIGESIFGS
jgi:hypothetical protein